MHSVERSPEPAFLAAMRAAYPQWADLNASDRQAIREALRADFGQCCAYCENRCDIAGNGASLETVDHFRPRSKFPRQALDWLNLVYACQRCNTTKGNLWPDESDAPNRRYAVVAGFAPVTAYVNPNAISDQRPAQEFFEFYFDGDNGGQIVPAAPLSPAEMLMAQRTIEDLDLNDDYGRVDQRLPELRTEHLDFILDEIGDPAADLARTESILRDYSRPGQPFASYVAAYALLLGIPDD